MVTSGYCSGGGPCPTEVIDFYGQNKTCNHLPDYPEGKNYGATGGLIDLDTYVSCGGNMIGDKCYKFGSTSPIAMMGQKRSRAASVVIGTQLWVVGGIGGNTNLDSTEFVNPANGSVEPGPDLPKESYAHCLVRTNTTTVMFIGGSPDPQDKTWTYNFEREDQGWIPGPNLNTGRRRHACGVVKDLADESKTIVIVAAGFNDNGGGNLKSTEYFVLGSHQWRKGPDLEYRMVSASGVTTPDGKIFFFVGGENVDESYKKEDRIYKLECRNLECHPWTRVDQKLGVGRKSFLAAFLLNSLLGCN